MHTYCVLVILSCILEPQSFQNPIILSENYCQLHYLFLIFCINGKMSYASHTNNYHLKMIYALFQSGYARNTLTVVKGFLQNHFHLQKRIILLKNPMYEVELPRSTAKPNIKSRKKNGEQRSEHCHLRSLQLFWYCKKPNHSRKRH